MLEQMQMLHIHPMIIITFVTVCEMKWSRIKSGIIGTLNIFPLLPPELRIIQTKVGNREFSTRVFVSYENI